MLGLGNSIIGGAALEEARFSLLLDGTGDFARTDVTEINSLTNFSVSLWFKYPSDISFSTSNNIMAAGGSAHGSRFYLQLLTATSIRIGSSGQFDDVTGLTSMAADTWHHIAVSTASTVSRLYINGVDENDANITTSAPASNMGSNWTIGKGITTSSFFFDGNITDVAVFDAAISSGTVTSIYNGGKPTNLVGTSNLQGYWRMTTVADSSGNGNDLTLSGDAVITEDAP